MNLNACASGTTALLIAFVCTNAAQPVAAPPSDLLSVSADALGGREKIAALKTLHTRMQLQMAGMTGQVEVWNTADGKMRQHVKLAQVMEQLVVFDGVNGWMKDHNQHVMALEGPELQSTITGAYLDSFSYLVQGRMKGDVQIVYGDKASPESRIIVNPQGGNAATITLDPETYLPSRQQRREGSQNVILTFSDWREVEGVKFPFQFKQSTGDARFDVTSTVQEIRLNEQFAKDLFEKPTESAVAVRFTTAGGRTEIPAEFVNNHIFIPVRVNGSAPLDFILDTGAETSAIDKASAKSLGIQTHGMLEAQGSGGSTDVSIATGLTFTFQGVELPDQTAAAIALDPLAPFEGRKIDGIIGYELFRQCIVEIDYSGGKVILHDPAKYKYTGAGVSVPFAFESKMPNIEGSVVFADKTLTGKFAIDTGSRGAITLNTGFTPPPSFEAASVRTLCGIGVGGESFCRMGRAASLRLGSVEVTDPVVGFSDDTRGSMVDPDRAGLIGGDILRRYRVVFDYPGKRMMLERDPRCDATMDWDMSGMWMTAPAPEFKNFAVHRVMEGSPAAEAGLRVGDLITSIDGRVSGELSLSEARRLLRQGPRSVSLRVVRDGTPMEVTLRLRRLL